jgi:Na+/H+-translocating membrane pyrophosphatase
VVGRVVAGIHVAAQSLTAFPSLVCASFGPLAGMMIATMANARTAEACRTSISAGLQVSFASGAVMGNAVVGLALGGLWVLYLM